MEKLKICVGSTIILIEENVFRGLYIEEVPLTNLRDNMITRLNCVFCTELLQSRSLAGNLQVSIGGKLVDDIKSKIQQYAPSNPDKYKTWVAILSLVVTDAYSSKIGYCI